MKLVHQSPERLILLHRPVLLCAALLAGAVCLLAVTVWAMSQGEWIKAGVGCLAVTGLLGPALWFAAERVDVSLDADTSTCTITTRRLTGSAFESYPLDHLERAMVQTHKGPGDSADAHRVALVITSGRTEDRRPLTTGYASGRQAEEIVSRINSWLAGRNSGSS